MEFNYLGKRTTEAINFEDLDIFPTPEYVTKVTLKSNELTAFCPVTEQPDFYEITIEYTPDKSCVETKSLKLYLQSFRERRCFAEALCAEICNALYNRLQPKSIQVQLNQQVRGGIQLSATAKRNKQAESLKDIIDKVETLDWRLE